MASRHALWALVAGSALLRLGLAAGLGPSNDEAYYALFTAHPDWSFFDHPPMVALIAGAGQWLGGGPPCVLSLRIGFIALFAGSTLMMGRLAERLYGPRAGFLAALAFNASGYFGVITGTFALPDGPLVFFWLWTIDRLAAAFEAAPDRLGPWAGVGLAWSGALLSKYHAVFLPAGTLLYVALQPALWHWLRRPGPYLAAALGLILFLPVLIWNADHGWASFAFQGQRALGPGRWRLATLGVALAGQALYLFPWMWAAAVGVVIQGLRQWSRDARAAHRLLLCQAALPLAAFTAVACRREVLPHWSLVGFLSLWPLVGQRWAERLALRPAAVRVRLGLVALVPVLLGGLAALQAKTGWFQQGGRGTLGLVAPAQDPSLDLMGWDQVASGLAERGLLTRPDTFLFTGLWFTSGQLAFATGNRLPVLCYHPHDTRGFAFWSRPEQWLGRDGILVAIDHRSIEPGCYERYFERIEPIAQFPIVRAGVPVHTVRLFRCIGQRLAFPFDRAAGSPAVSLAAQPERGLGR